MGHVHLTVRWNRITQNGVYTLSPYIVLLSPRWFHGKFSTIDCYSSPWLGTLHGSSLLKWSLFVPRKPSEGFRSGEFSLTSLEPNKRSLNSWFWKYTDILLAIGYFHLGVSQSGAAKKLSIHTLSNTWFGLTHNASQPCCPPRWKCPIAKKDVSVLSESRIKRPFVRFHSFLLESIWIDSFLAAPGWLTYKYHHSTKAILENVMSLLPSVLLRVCSTSNNANGKNQVIFFLV